MVSEISRELRILRFCRDYGLSGFGNCGKFGISIDGICVG